jgi:Transcriptional regulator, AbiEi antitoxin
MRDKFAPVDARIGELARQQHGVVSVRQLLALGLTRAGVSRRAKAGRLYPLHIGVYAVGHRAITQHGRWMAAVLACGEEAVLSHRAAAALWSLAQVPNARIDVSVGRSRRQHRRGIAIHRPRELADGDRTVRWRVPVTTPTRTLGDLAAVVSPTQLRRAFEAADRLELLDTKRLERLCDVAGPRKGIGRLRAFIAEYRPLPETRSNLERRFLRFCQERGLPMPAVNVPATGYEVDAYWPDRGLVVELDGYATHHSRRSFESDRVRNAASRPRASRGSRHRSPAETRGSSTRG